VFEPLPEDRDQAFSRFSGLLLAMARATHPKFMDWKPHYENFEGWMTQGGEVDRWMLSALDRAAFEETAADLAARLTDEVIERAVARLPFGFGNDTASEPPEGGDESYFDADSDTYDLFVSSWWATARTLELFAGPEVMLTHTGQSGFIGVDQPLGMGQFAQAGLKGGFDLDTRGHRRTGTLGDQFRAEGKPAQSGVRLKLEGFYYPDVWDSSGFGGIDGNLRGYLAGRRAMLAARLGGRRVWGDTPWFEAAFVGGSKSLRGYRKNRFAGDASLYANLEARVWLFKGRLIAPGRWGAFALADAGRVYQDGGSPGAWHASWGGGIFFQMLTLNTVFHGAVAHGDEGTRFYVDYGFAF
jgi:hypothetical protein